MFTTIEHTIERRRRGDALVHPITQDEIVTHVIRIDGLTDNLSDEFHHELSRVVVDEAKRQIESKATQILDSDSEGKEKMRQKFLQSVIFGK